MIANVFVNGGQSYVVMFNRSRLRRATVSVGGIRLLLKRQQFRVLGPFPLKPFGREVWYTAPRRVTVDVHYWPAFTSMADLIQALAEKGVKVTTLDDPKADIT